MLEAFMSPFVRAVTRIESESDAEGWRVARIPVGSVRQTCVELLRFGADIEVMAPPELRAKMVEVAAAMNMIYVQ